MDDIDRIIDDDFIPNNLDILHTHVQTTGIVEIDFSFKNIKFWLVYNIIF